MFANQLYTGRRLFGRVVVLFTLLALLTACGGGNQSQQSTRSTPTPAQSTSGSSHMVLFSLGIPPAALNSPTVGTLPPSTPLHVIVTFKPNDALINKLARQTNSKKQPTDVTSLANQLGITNQQYQQIKAFFGIQGVSLNLSKLHTMLELDAQTSTFAMLLHTTFVYHQYQGHKFFAPAMSIMIPQAIASHIEAITGLDNYSKSPSPLDLASNAQPLNVKQINSNNCVTIASADNAQQISGSYGLNAFYAQGWKGQGTTIILPEFQGFSRSDLQQYLSCEHFGNLTL